MNMIGGVPFKGPLVDGVPDMVVVDGGVTVGFTEEMVGGGIWGVLVRGVLGVGVWNRRPHWSRRTR